MASQTDDLPGSVYRAMVMYQQNRGRKPLKVAMSRATWEQSIVGIDFVVHGRRVTVPRLWGLAVDLEPTVPDGEFIIYS